MGEDKVNKFDKAVNKKTSELIKSKILHSIRLSVVFIGS